MRCLESLVVTMGLLLCLFVFSTLAPVSAAVVKPAGMEKKAIEPSNTSEMTDIHDIKPLESIRIAWNWRLALIIGSVLLGLLMVSWLLYRYLVKRKSAEEVMPSPLQPHAIALGELSLLKERMRMLEGKDFYFRLSYVLRHYMEGRWRINALEMTREELAPKLAELALSPDLRAGVKNFLDDSDQVKFAGDAASIGQMQRHIEFIEQFVNKTMPTETMETEKTEA